MSFLKDIIKLFKKHSMIYIDKRQEGTDTDTVTFAFEVEKGFNWIPGQHIILTIDSLDKNQKPTRGFSVASVPQEGKLLVGTRITEKPSPYKKALSELKPGDKVTVKGPIGSFYPDGSRKPVLFIAGGIGITPYRALLKDAASNPDIAPQSIRLLYSQDQGDFVYTEEIDSIALKNDFITVNYITDRAKLQEEIREYALKQGNNAQYFISGAPGMVKFIKGALKEIGIKGRNIKNDPFYGY